MEKIKIMEKNTGFKMFMVGFLGVLVLSSVLNIIITNLNFIESYGIIMFGTTIFGGYQAYKDTENADIPE